MDETIKYKVKVSRRARRMRIAVYCDSSVVITLPVGIDFGRAENFIREKFGWIIKTLERLRPYKDRIILKSGKREYKKHRSQALQLAENKVNFWNQFYGFGFAKINIKNQRTRWGSCSKKGNLNFNYRIIRLPEKQVDYLVVHELCHLSEFNHGKSFWELVARTIPNYKQLRQQLRGI